jgi:NhaP-type Na+/H+ or K+/H+ antiporter
MAAVALFGVTLIVATLLSGIAHRTVLSTAVLFLVVGVVAGITHLVELEPGAQPVRALASAALVSVLFTDGMHAGLPELRRDWRLPVRALGIGLPITLVLIALVARLVAGTSWVESFLVGAALSPTDPVLAAAIVGREEVPARVRHLLNVESGLNDGLALPVVIVLLALLQHERADPLRTAAELLGGVALGVAVPVAVMFLRRIPHPAATATYAPLGPVGMVLAVYGIASVTGANPFLAAFAAGSTVATVMPELHREFASFGELFTELLKLAALLAFGALLAGPGAHLGAKVAAFAVAALVLPRIIGIVVSMVGARLPAKELATVAWFGPRGFASVVYGLTILGSGVPRHVALYELVAATTALSILVQSSSDSLVARRFGDDA